MYIVSQHVEQMGTCLPLNAKTNPSKPSAQIIEHPL